MPVVSDHTALLSGSYWNGIEVSGKPAIVTYSFPSTAPDYLAGIAGFTPATVASFQELTPDMRMQARYALLEWAGSANITFIEVLPGQGDINFQLVDLQTSSYAGAGGIGFYPFGDWNGFTYPDFRSDFDAAGDVFLNSALVSGGALDHATLLHEIGHAIGLKHPTEIVTDFAADPDVVHDQVLATDDPFQTIMATTGGGTGHLTALDQAAATFLYGTGIGHVVTGSPWSGSSWVSSWGYDSAAQTLTQIGNDAGDTIRGTSVIDVIHGLEGDNRLFGLAGGDILTAGAGDDLLEGGSGIDSMAGGAGDDRYFVDSSGDVIWEESGAGSDTVYATADFSLVGQHVETLILLGNADLSATGNAQENSLFGNAGNNLLESGGGSDTLVGGAGDDTYRIDGGDLLFENPGEGVDSVESTVSYHLAANLEKLRLLGGGNLNATGNSLANLLTGNSGNNVLDGQGGADTMAGGMGNDTYVVDHVGDVVQEANGAGTDTVQASVSYSLAGQFLENLTLVFSQNLSATGNSLGNVLTGNNGNNLIDGGLGDDTMAGGLGDDTYLVNSTLDVVTEYANQGTDTVISQVGYTLSGSHIENLTLTGSTSTYANGNGLDNILIGNSGANTMNARGGNDVLNGGLGADTLTGEAGLDVFRFDSALGGGNVDTITDFVVADDTIQLDDAIFAAAGAPGTLAGAAFWTGTAAHDLDDRIVYNAATGALFYDADGSNAGAAVQFATLTAGLALSSADFVVV